MGLLAAVIATAGVTVAGHAEPQYLPVNMSSAFNYRMQNLCCDSALYTLQGPQVLAGVPCVIGPVSGNNAVRLDGPDSASLYLYEFVNNAYCGVEGVRAVHTFVNTWNGNTNPDLARVVLRANGGPWYAHPFVGGVDIRDHAQRAFTNSINNTTTTNAWSSGTNPGHVRIDKQRIALPSALNGFPLFEIAFEDDGSLLTQRMLVFAVTLEIEPTLTIASEPACPSGPALFSVVGPGLSGAQYRWQINDPVHPGHWIDLNNGPFPTPTAPAGNFTVSGADLPALSVKPSAGTQFGPEHSRSFRCIATRNGPSCPIGALSSSAQLVTHPCVPVSGQFLGGMVTGGGSPSPATSYPGVVGPAGGSGGGSTGGGIGSATMTLAWADSGGVTTMTATGSAYHTLPGFGSTRANTSGVTFVVGTDTRFTILNQSVRFDGNGNPIGPFDPLNALSPVSGHIVRSGSAGTLAAGTYAIDLSIGAGPDVGTFPTTISSSLNWRLQLSKYRCSIADITRVGGTAAEFGEPDLQLSVDDIIVFVNTFTDGVGCPQSAPSACNVADVTAVGGPPLAPDGQLTVDDIIAFVNAFSEGC